VLREGNRRSLKHWKIPSSSGGHVGQNKKCAGHTIQRRNKSTKLQDDEHDSTVRGLQMDKDNKHGTNSDV
jgi:hypothetical protein